MPRSEFQAQLEALRADVVDLGDLVLTRYDQALEAMRSGDVELARSVRDRDRDVNRRYLALESDCIDLFALQQPVASDLRFVAASFKILTDLERVGDLATNLADYAGHTGGARYPSIDLVAAGAFAGEMLRDAMAAYRAADAAACRTVAARDDELDERCAGAARTVFADLLAAPDADATEAVVDDATRCLLVIRDVERVGDHAVNVCARTLYATAHDTDLLY